MSKYLVTWTTSESGDEPESLCLMQEEVVIDADSALQAEVTVSEEYGVRRSLLTVKKVA